MLLWYGIALLVAVLAAWIAESYRNGNRLWAYLYVHVVEYIYDNVYLGTFRALMRHANDPKYTHVARHSK